MLTSRQSTKATVQNRTRKSSVQTEFVNGGSKQYKRITQVAVKVFKTGQTGQTGRITLERMVRYAIQSGSELKKRRGLNKTGNDR